MKKIITLISIAFAITITSCTSKDVEPDKNWTIRDGNYILDSKLEYNYYITKDTAEAVMFSYVALNVYKDQNIIVGKWTKEIWERGKLIQTITTAKKDTFLYDASMYQTTKVFKPVYSAQGNEQITAVALSNGRTSRVYYSIHDILKYGYLERDFRPKN